MDQTCIFCEIAKGNMPSEILYRDQRVFAIKDIAPRAPIHILVIPVEHEVEISGIRPSDESILGHTIEVAGMLAKSQGLLESGYRLVVNQGEDANQTVAHLHVHLLGGRKLGPEG